MSLLGKPLNPSMPDLAGIVDQENIGIMSGGATGCNPLTLVFAVWQFVACGKPWVLLNQLLVSVRGTAVMDP